MPTDAMQARAREIAYCERMMISVLSGDDSAWLEAEIAAALSAAAAEADKQATERAAKIAARFHTIGGEPSELTTQIAAAIRSGGQHALSPPSAGAGDDGEQKC